MKEFRTASSGKPPIEFGLDGVTMKAAAKAPADALTAMANIAAGIDESGVLKPEQVPGLVAAINDFLDLVMFPESAEHIASRMRDPQNPLGWEDLADLSRWLIEEHYT